MASPTSVLISTKLIKNSSVECVKFLDNDDLKLKLQLNIEHKNMILNKRIKTLEKKEIITPREIQSIINFSKYLIIILLTSYKNNILIIFLLIKYDLSPYLRKKNKNYISSQYYKT